MIENFMIKEKNLSRDQIKKKGFLKGVAIGGLIIIIIISVYQVLIIPSVRRSTKEKTLNNLNGTKQYEYVLTKNIDQGQTIDVNKDCKIILTDDNAVPDNAISTSTVAKISKMVTRIKLNKKTPLTTDMFVNLNDYITADLRNQDYTDIVLSKNLKIGDYIDIRYKHKDGSDDIVVSKKKVLGLNGQTVILNVLEGERRYKNNATVSAALTGGTLYTTIYPDPQNQDAAKVNYVLDDNIDKLINVNPGTVKQSSDTLTQRNQASIDTASKPEFANGGN